MNRTCIICNHNDFNILLNYNNEKVVTSDNKIANQNFQLLECKRCSHVQKKIDSNLLKIIDKIYAEYEAYYLTGGEEEAKIDSNNTNTNRSKTIVNNIADIVKQDGNILDIGTGSGVFLEEFLKVFNWDLFAQDVKISKNNNLHKLKNFKIFFIQNKEPLDSDFFDIISAIHVFEHIIDLEEFLLSIKKSLKADGVLVLQVPNIYENLFDIFIIDHISHFHRSTIFYILKKYFKFVYFPKNQIYREITAIATDKEIEFSHDTSMEQKEINKEKINGLIVSLVDMDNTIAIFGTSPPALFCATLLNFKIDYFVDENLKKTDKKLFDKNIIHPSDVDSDIQVLFPYSKEVLMDIKKRYPSLNLIYIESTI
ncbi:MAG: class I SAM-dependent methyltransferase [Sulfurimonas sp.]|nr:class I SAM-dependent methyltransferase [Sulfurimonas sp.]